MLLNRTVLALAAAALCARWRADAAPSAVRLCGRELGKIMSRVCIVYNSPAWDVPTEQPAAVARRKRDAGIAEECCNYGCTWDQLAEYCEIPNTEDFISDLDTHMIADRSAEKEVVPSVVAAPRQARAQAASAARVVHAASAAHAAGSASEARVASAARGRARMRQREALERSAARAAPVVGTVSPLLTWGRTLNTDSPPHDRNRYAYVALYNK